MNGELFPDIGEPDVLPAELDALFRGAPRQAKRVYITLLDAATWTGDKPRARIRQADIAERSGLSRKTVRQSLDWLRVNG